MSSAVSLHRSEIDGIPVVWAPGPEPFTAGLSFRVGQVDETLPRHGVTHLVEHLCFTDISSRDTSHNGFVDATSCNFWARGRRDDVLDFLRDICRGISSVPVDRFEKERDVLRAEEHSNPPGPINFLLSLRYGATGPGLSAFHQFALDRLDATDVLLDWARTRFVRGNCGVWMTGEPPEDLGLRLGEGERHETPQPTPLPVHMPSVYQVNAATTHVSFESERTVAAWFSQFLLGRRLSDVLRKREGLVYGVQPLYLPLSRDRAFLSLSISSTQEASAGVTSRILSELDMLSQDGFTENEIEETRNEFRRAQNDPFALPSLLAGSLGSELVRGEWQAPDEVYEELGALDSAATAVAVRDLLASRISAAPELRDDEVPYGPIEEKSLNGERFMPKNPFGRLRGQRFFVGQDGVAQERPLFSDIVYFRDAVAVFAFSENRRSLWGRDGTCVEVDPKDWTGGRKIDRAIDARTEAQQIPMRDDAFPLCSWQGPEPVPLAVPSRARRLVARAIDTAIVLPIMAWIIGKAIEVHPDGAPIDGAEPNVGLANLIFFSAFLVFLVYEVLCTAVLKQSLGKWATKTAVIHRETGKRLGLWDATRRAVLLLASAFPLMTVAQISMVLRDPDRRGHHDQIADSVVVNRSVVKE